MDDPANPDDADYAYGGILPGPFDSCTGEHADAARAMKRRILELLTEPYTPQSLPSEAGQINNAREDAS